LSGVTDAANIPYHIWAHLSIAEHFFFIFKAPDLDISGFRNPFADLITFFTQSFGGELIEIYWR
jgi:hypothetical protein